VSGEKPFYQENFLFLAAYGLFHSCFLYFCHLHSKSIKQSMSVIQRIRDKATWIIFTTIALALIAFILQDGSFRRGGSMFSNTTSVAKVNGVKIEKKDFDTKVELYQQMQGAQGTPRNQLSASVWSMMVEQEVLQQQLTKLGLSVPGRELTDILFSPNSPFAREFTDPQTGVFDQEKARQTFAQLKKSKNAEQQQMVERIYIEPAVLQTLRQKYQSLITQAVYIPKWMAEKSNTDNNSIATISYVYAPYASISDSTVKVSDDEIAAYVNKHAKEFKQEEETRSISYVTFDASPSGTDSAAVLQQLNELRNEFATTADVKAFLGSKGTELPYGDLYVTKNNMKMPNADTIMTLADGQVYGPYLDGGNFTLAKMISHREMPDSVKVRHILIKVADQGGQPVLADSLAKKRIDSIVTAINGGASFAALVQQYSDDPGSKATGGEYQFSSMQFGGLSKEFAEVAFYGNAGEKKVVKVENGSYTGYHYIEVLEQKNKQIAYKVASLSKPITSSQETISAASTAAQQFAAVGNKSKKAFDEAAAKQNKFPMSSPDIKENDFSVMGLGESRPFVKWIFESEGGDVSEPTEIGDRYVVAVITAVNKAGLLSAHAARPAVESVLKNEKKAQQLINTKFKGNSLEAYAQSAGTSIQRADSLSFQSFSLPGVGTEPKVIGAAFNKNIQAKVSEPIAGVTGVFAVKGEGISAKPSFGVIDDQRKSIENNMRSQIGYRAMDALRKAATVKDLRSTFY
jgi:peptidyl-prolyl cis-trans isomerase D